MIRYKGRHISGTMALDYGWCGSLERKKNTTRCVVCACRLRYRWFVLLSRNNKKQILLKGEPWLAQQ